MVEARVLGGAASSLDLAQQRGVVATQRAGIPALETQARQAENALAILLGNAPAGATAVTGELMRVEPPMPAPGLPSGLLARRPDIQAAEAQLVAANAEIGAARAAFFPSVDLTGRNGYASSVLSSLFDPAGRTYSLAAGLTQSIFDGGNRSGQVDLAKARYAELIQTYRQAVISAFGDVENALVAARRTEEQEVVQSDAVEQARLAYQLADARYRAGAVDLLTVLDAQRTLYQAEDQAVQIRLARLQAAVALFKALGGGWELPTEVSRATDDGPAMSQP